MIVRVVVHAALVLAGGCSSAELLEGLRALDGALETHDHDLGAAAEAGVDLSVANDPSFTRAAVRIEAYRDQVCT